MSGAARWAVRAAAVMLPPVALLAGRRGQLARLAAGAWIVGLGMFWLLAAGPGAILVLIAMLLAPLAV